MTYMHKLAALGTALAATLPAVTPALGDSPRTDGVRAAIQHGTLVVKGNQAGNRIALHLRAGDPSVVEIDTGDGSAGFSFERADIAAIEVKGGNGGDSINIDDSRGSFTDTIPTTIAGGPGNDRLAGGLGGETFNAGPGDDVVVGGKGADTAYLGEGDDSFRWDPGDGSDVIEGQQGSDEMLFVGAAGADTATLTANGRRLTFFRQPGNVTMDTRGVETVDFDTLGGPDNVTVNDLSGTDVTRTNIDLASSVGGTTADGVVDHVVVNGTDGDDNIAVTGSGSAVDVTGLASTVSVQHPDATDTLAVNTLGGNDNVFTNGVGGLLQLFVDGVQS
jgi:Ca2+-binding RTX toxin-like protein